MELAEQDKHNLAHYAMDGLIASGLIKWELMQFDGKTYVKVYMRWFGMMINIGTLQVERGP